MQRTPLCFDLESGWSEKLYLFAPFKKAKSNTFSSLYF
jgi:hypothetical protein